MDCFVVGTANTGAIGRGASPLIFLCKISILLSKSSTEFPLLLAAAISCSSLEILDSVSCASIFSASRRARCACALSALACSKGENGSGFTSLGISWIGIVSVVVVLIVIGAVSTVVFSGMALSLPFITLAKNGTPASVSVGVLLSETISTNVSEELSLSLPISSLFFLFCQKK